MAIGIAALVLGLLHLLVAFLLSSEVTVALILHIVVANSLVGLITGYSY